MDKQITTIYTRCAEPLRIRTQADGTPSRTIEGCAIVFGQEGLVMRSPDEEIREVIMPGAITRELLDRCDIKMTLNHDPQQLLGRSQEGRGTLGYDVRDDGVHFSFEAPHTVDGDKALELVRRGDISGCSFAFIPARGGYKVSRAQEGDKTVYHCEVTSVREVLDFSLVVTPAYPQTSVSLRRYADAAGPDAAMQAAIEAQAAEMERAAE